MRRSYLGAWLLILACAGAAAEWVLAGRAFVRRTAYAPAPVLESARTESSFLAVLLPHISAESEKRAMSAAELARFLNGLKAGGYVPIGLSDVRDLYAKGRRLPPKAILVTFAEDDLLGVGRADAALKAARWRAVLFITGTASGSAAELDHQLLTPHAQNQMRLGQAWEFGAISSAEPPSAPETGGIRALLDDDGRRPAPNRPDLYPLRFAASDLGYNDEHDAPAALHVLALRGDPSPEADLRIVNNAWPRTSEFSDDFSKDGAGADWITSWGIASTENGRLALLPTPRQSGAGVFLRGTEKWRDVALEFELQKHQRQFWAYARYKADGSFVRFGARDGYWYVDQKTGPKSLSRQLARAPIIADGRPARVRLVLKGGSLLVHVNGRMQFGRLLRLSPAVDQGRILFGVYDEKGRSALAVFTSVRAAPLGREWIAPKPGAARGFDEDRLEGLREEAVSARALSPRWIHVAADGAVSADETQSALVRSMAGFYGCRLVPMAELPPAGSSVFGNPESAAKALAGLLEADRGLGLGIAGLNLRLRGGDVERPKTIAFLKKARGGLRARRQELWVTIEDDRTSDAELAGAVNGVLRISKQKRADLEILEAAPNFSETAANKRPQMPLETASRAQWEPATIQ